MPLTLQLEISGPADLQLKGQFMLAVMFAHAVELQYQMLHGTGIRAPRWARRVGTVLGAPLLVSYTPYRVLHLRHHRFLGTDQDTEFFRYSASDALTLTAMGASAFDVRRWVVANYCVSYPQFYRMVFAHAWRTQRDRQDSHGNGRTVPSGAGTGKQDPV
jgi:hypothetical protein